MNAICDCPQGTFGEWRFRLFGVPVRVKIWFWLAVLLTGLSPDTATTLIWAGVCFVSILIHEFGHVFALRAFGVRSEVALYGFGGLTIPQREPRGTPARFVVSVAGPLAGFAVVALVLLAAPMPIVFRWLPFPGFFPVPDEMLSRPQMYRFLLLYDVLLVNFFWGLVNLLPIYPLDGGRAARAVFMELDRFRGRRKSLILSVVAAGAVALLGLAMMSLYVTVLFLLLAILSVQALETEPK